MTEFDEEGEEQKESNDDDIIPEAVQHNLANMKGWFTENQGQIENSDVKFVYGASDLSIGFIESGYLIKLTNEENLTSVVKVTFEGANRVMPEGRGELEHKNNYFRGNDYSKWRAGVSNYMTVVFQNLYKGIDLVFYTTKDGLKYDYTIFPDGNPNDINIRYHGTDDIFIDEIGNCHLISTSGEIIENKPYCYQLIDNDIIEVNSQFLLNGNIINFFIGHYETSLELIIDPLIFSTFIGGIMGESGWSCTVDDDSNIYITGSTASPEFPTSESAYDRIYNGDSDTFILKITPSGSEILYSTFIGGIGGEGASKIIIDENSNSLVTGTTDSENFPTTSGAYDTTYNGGISDCFITKLNNVGTALIFSTYIGGNDDECGNDIVIDFDDNVYITGFTLSDDFPTTPGAYDTHYGGGIGGFEADAFITKLKSDGSDLIYSTYIGGETSWDESGAIYIDDSNNAYIAGYTASIDFPTTLGAYDMIYNNAGDGFILILNSEGNGLIHSTFLGGLGEDVVRDISFDDDGSIHATGYTRSRNFPTTSDAYDRELGGFTDTFISKLDLTLSTLLYSSYFGGEDNGEEYGIDLYIDANSITYITGYVGTSDFPTLTGAYDSTYNGEVDSFILSLDTINSSLLYSSYFGGSSREIGRGIIIEESNLVVMVGYTESNDFPTTSSAYDTSHNGNSDVYVAKLSIFLGNIPPMLTIISPPNNSEVSGNISINGTASDENGNNTIEFVEVSIDSSDWESVNGTNKWDYQWNTTTVENGEHSLRFRAYDGELHSDIQELILDVQNNRPPELTITSPDNNSEVDGQITIEGESSDVDGDETIESVDISIDDTTWEEVLGTTSWSYEWDTTEHTNGEHILQFRAYDGENYSVIEELTLNVQNKNKIPEVTTDYPEDGADVEGTITISGTATDEDGDEAIETVELSIDGGEWEAATGTTSWDYDWDTTLHSDGTYTVEVRAFDGIDYSGVQEITLNVKNAQENIKPEVTILAPLPNFEVKDEVYCTGKATDEDGEIEKVEMSIDGGQWFTVQGKDVWAYSWDSKSVENGIHTVSVRSYDGEDYSDEVIVTFTVNNVKDSGEEDEWYDEPVNIGGLTAVIIVVVIVVAVLFTRKRSEEYYGDWGDEEGGDDEYYEDEW